VLVRFAGITYEASATRAGEAPDLFCSAATKNCKRCLDSVHTLELDAAKEARKVAFAAVGKEMEDNPNHPLVRTICCASMLQKRVNSPPATSDDAGHLQEKLQAAYNSREEGRDVCTSHYKSDGVLADSCRSQGTVPKT
jgi:hypothetical protein